MVEFKRKDSIFYNRESEFLQLFLYSNQKSCIAYVRSDWDHDEAYYLDLPFSTGEYDPLYDVIKNDPSITFPEDIELMEDCEDECDD